MNAPLDTFASGCGVTRGQAVAGPQSAKRLKLSPMTPVGAHGQYAGILDRAVSRRYKGIASSARTGRLDGPDRGSVPSMALRKAVEQE